MFYEDGILIDDPDHLTPYWDKFKKPPKDNKYILKFTTDFPKDLHNQASNIFSTISVADPEYLSEYSIIEKTNNNPVVFFKNICLFQFLTIEQFQQILGFCLNRNVSQLEIYIYNNNRWDKLNTLLEELTYTQTEFFMQYISIGAHNYMIKILDIEANVINNYEQMFYHSYFELGSFIYLISNNLSITLPQPSINKISYIYEPNVNITIDICKLFNINNTKGAFSKIYLQSKRYDDYYGYLRDMQHVKISNKHKNTAFTSITPTYEVCRMYYGIEIYNGITLTAIDVFNNATVEFIFMNVNVSSSYEELDKIIQTYLNKNDEKIFKMINISECVYNNDFDEQEYKRYNGLISSSINIFNSSNSDISVATNITKQSIPSVIFSSKTSIKMSGYAMIHPTSILKYKYLFYNKNLVSDNVMKTFYMPTIHVGSIGGKTTIKIDNSFSYNELIQSYLFIISSFDNIKKRLTSITKQQKSSAITPEEIIKKAKSFNKKELLKVLYTYDPILFGPRLVSKTPRPYSGLAQQVEQRVVPITPAEYEIMYNYAPERVANIQNQTYKDYRLYLLCPYNKTPYINFHSIPNQICIPRCTSKLSNKSQLAFCAKALDAQNVFDLEYKHENQSITYYNPIISVGRKCKVPKELLEAFQKYLLQKLDVGINNINQYINDSYDKHAFIIQRVPNEFKYNIISEYSEEFDYILILQSEISEECFIFLNEKTNKPLVFSLEPTIKKFFSSVSQKTQEQYNFFNYIEKIFNISIFQNYSDTVNNILDFIAGEKNIKYIINKNNIVGVINNKTVYLTPKMFVYNINDVDTINLSEIDAKNITFPKLDQFNKEDINCVYKDYNSNEICAIIYSNVFTFVTSSKNVIDNVPEKMFDFNSFISLYFAAKDLIPKSENNVFNIKELIDSWIFAYIIDTNSTEFEVNNFLKFCYSNNWISDITNINYVSENVISWRNSEISKNEFDEYFKNFIPTTNFTTKIIYNILHNDIKSIPLNDEVIEHKIITA